MKKTLLLLFVVAQFAAMAQHQTPLQPGRPESVGMSSARLARLDAIFENSVQKGDLPGIVALVARNGKIVYLKSFGMADNTSKRPLKTDDIFRIASMSKAVTATAVMMLWEEGKFYLDDPISKYIPEFKKPMVLDTFIQRDSTWAGHPAKSEITIRQLLTHTSGIGYGVIDGDPRFKAIYKKAGIVDLFTTEPVKIGDNIKKLAALPLHHEPGEKYTYSEGLDVLGYFIEVVSGMPFDQFLQQRLFDPLGMNDTRFYLPDAKAGRLVSVQRPTENGQWERYPVTFYDTDYPIKGAKTFFSGGAGLSSTARDYALFLQMYLNGGELNGQRILGRKTIETIMANQVGDLWGGDKGESHYGLAFGVLNQPGADKGGQGSTGTFSWGGYFNTNYFADPQEKIIGVLMKQTQNTRSDDLNRMFRQLIMQAVVD